MDRGKKNLMFVMIIGFLIGIAVGISVVLFNLQGYECVPKAEYEAMVNLIAPFLR